MFVQLIISLFSQTKDFSKLLVNKINPKKYGEIFIKLAGFYCLFTSGFTIIIRGNWILSGHGIFSVLMWAVLICIPIYMIGIIKGKFEPKTGSVLFAIGSYILCTLILMNVAPFNLN